MTNSSSLTPQPTVSPAPEHRAPRLLIPAFGPLYAVAEPLGYALLRAAFGFIMVTHGVPKLLGTSHGSMADPMGGSINLIENVLHLPAAPAIALFVAILEGIGGALLALGLWVRPIALALAGQMVGICVALGPKWVWLDRGIEFPVTLFFVALFLAVKGAGSYSVDRAIGREL